MGRTSGELVYTHGGELVMGVLGEPDGWRRKATTCGIGHGIAAAKAVEASLAHAKRLCQSLQHLARPPALYRRPHGVQIAGVGGARAIGRGLAKDMAGQCAPSSGSLPLVAMGGGERAAPPSSQWEDLLEQTEADSVWDALVSDCDDCGAPPESRGEACAFAEDVGGAAAEARQAPKAERRGRKRRHEQFVHLAVEAARLGMADAPEPQAIAGVVVAGARVPHDANRLGDSRHAPAAEQELALAVLEW